MDTQFEEMRQQLTILKEKLNQQEIINDRLLRQSMRRNVTDINRRYLIISILCLFMIPYGYWAFVYLNGISIGFWAASSVVMLIAFIYTFFNGKDLRSQHLLSANLLEAYQTVARAKKRDHDWLKIGIPLIILWLGYFGYEVFRLYSGTDAKIFITIGAICGLAGAAIGLKLHFRTQRNYQDILEQIEDLQQ